MGEIIALVKDQIQAKAYLAMPKQETAPGVLVFHAWWGLNEFARQFADRVSHEGFIALAPDYYGGEIASSIDQAKTLKSKYDRVYIYALAKQALQDLTAIETVQPKEVAVIGFSLGCGPALELARSKPDAVRAVVLFYGTGGGKFDSARADFLGHFVEGDQWGAHARKVSALEGRLLKSKGKMEFHTYPHTKHWFFESDRLDAYNKEAAEEVWGLTRRFLKKELS